MKVSLDLLPVKMRLPLKFGAETIDSIKIAHVELEAYGARGIGETPLSVAWSWPSERSFSEREDIMCDFCRFLAENWYEAVQHPMTEGKIFLDERLPELHEEFNAKNNTDMPHLAALICASAFDIAVHDAYGNSLGKSTYAAYNKEYMEHDLAWFYGDDSFAGKYPSDYFVSVSDTLPVWHLVGGKDLLTEAELTGNEPDDGYPVTLTEWIKRDGLTCLKIKIGRAHV